MPPLRIVLADDHTLVRAGLRALLDRMPGVEVVGEAADGRQALKLVEALSPDIVLMDIGMPAMNGLETTARITKQMPGARVVVVSVHSSPESVLEAIDAGAAGYVLKDASVAELELAIESVMRGGTYLSPNVSRYLVDDYRRRLGAPRGHPASTATGPFAERNRLAQLTPRQREVLQLLAEGASGRKIARMLNVSVKTVETHRAELMNRLGIHDVAGLVRFAIRSGMIRADGA